MPFQYNKYEKYAQLKSCLEVSLADLKKGYKAANTEGLKEPRRSQVQYLEDVIKITQKMKPADGDKAKLILNAAACFVYERIELSYIIRHPDNSDLHVSLKTDLGIDKVPDDKDLINMYGVLAEFNKSHHLGAGEKYAKDFTNPLNILSSRVELLKVNQAKKEEAAIKAASSSSSSLFGSIGSFFSSAPKKDDSDLKEQQQPASSMH
jgi:hypothetical protein